MRVKEVKIKNEWIGIWIKVWVGGMGIKTEVRGEIRINVNKNLVGTKWVGEMEMKTEKGDQNRVGDGMSIKTQRMRMKKQRRGQHQAIKRWKGTSWW